MSVNAETQTLVEIVPSVALVTPEAVLAAEPAAPGYLAYEAKRRAARPAWIVPAAIAGVGVVVAGMLGYALYATTQQRDAVRHQPTITASALKTTRGTCSGSSPTARPPVSQAR